MVSASIDKAEGKSLEQIKAEARAHIFATAEYSTSTTQETGSPASPAEEQHSAGVQNGTITDRHLATPPVGYSQNGDTFVGTSPDKVTANAAAPSLPPPEVAKNIPCRFYPNCKYGNECAFAHTGPTNAANESVGSMNGEYVSAANSAAMPAPYVGGFYYPNSLMPPGVPQNADPHASQGGMPVPVEYMAFAGQQMSPRPIPGGLPSNGAHSMKSPSMQPPNFSPVHPSMAPYFGNPYAARMPYPMPHYPGMQPYYMPHMPVSGPLQTQQLPVDGNSPTSPLGPGVPTAPKAFSQTMNGQPEPDGGYQQPSLISNRPAQPMSSSHNSAPQSAASVRSQSQPTLAAEQSRPHEYYSSSTSHNAAPMSQVHFNDSSSDAQAEAVLTASGLPLSPVIRSSKRHSLPLAAAASHRTSYLNDASAPNRPKSSVRSNFPPSHDSQRKNFPMPQSKVPCTFFSSDANSCKNGDACPFAHILPDGSDAKALGKNIVSVDGSIGDPAQLEDFKRREPWRKQKAAERIFRDRAREGGYSAAPREPSRGRSNYSAFSDAFGTLPGGKAASVSRAGTNRSQQRVPDGADFPALAVSSPSRPESLVRRADTPDSGSSTPPETMSVSLISQQTPQEAPKLASSWASAAAKGVSAAAAAPAAKRAVPQHKSAPQSPVARSPIASARALSPSVVTSPLLSPVAA